MTVARRRSTARSISSRFLALFTQAGRRATSVIFLPVSYQGARSRRSAATNRLIRSRCWRLYAHNSPCLVPVRSHKGGRGLVEGPVSIRHRPQDRQTRRVCGYLLPSASGGVHGRRSKWAIRSQRGQRTSTDDAKWASVARGSWKRTGDGDMP